MPRYTYRLQPALAVALGLVYHPGEWIYSLRARAEAASVELRLAEAQADRLRGDLLTVADSFSGDRFPLSHARPLAPDDPTLRLPTELEADVAELQVGRDPCRRLMFIRAEGQADGMPFEVQVWATPEQMVALAEQVDSARAQARSRCPICGEPLTDLPHTCPPEAAMGGL